MSKPTELETPPELHRGDRVVVTETGIRPWYGTVTTMKPSSVSGWWVDIRREDDGMTWQIQPGDIEVVSKEAGYVAFSLVIGLAMVIVLAMLFAHVVAALKVALP